MLWRCEQLCVWGAGHSSTHSQINGSVSAPPDQTVLSRTHTFLTHLRGGGGMPEESLLSVQASGSLDLSSGGHESSPSLMSLFVFFQSAASSDGGEYKSQLLSFH